MPFITLTIIALTTGFSLYCMNNPALKYKYIFHPYSIRHFKQHYRFLSHAFIHGSFLHLLFNMYALWIFGSVIEIGVYPRIFDGNMKLSSLCYILLYTGAIYAASITEYFRYRNDQNYSSLGASGAVNALIFSFILFAPTAQLGFIFIPRLPAWIFGLLYLGITMYLSRRSTGVSSVDRIDHVAHFWGAIYGVVFTGLLKPELFKDFIDKIIP